MFDFLKRPVIEYKSSGLPFYRSNGFQQVLYPETIKKLDEIVFSEDAKRLYYEIILQRKRGKAVSKFQEDIKKFNGIYKLPVATTPTLDVGVPAAERLKSFKNILSEELDEIDEIIDMVAVVDATGDKTDGVTKLSALTALADLLGDIQVYCASEMAKFGIPLDETLAIIMESNFSKLGADGKPIYDERGKVMKGPAYWKPEPKIKEMLASKFDTNSISKDIG